MWAIAIGFILIPLACSPLISDNYTPVKWFVVYAITVAILIQMLVQTIRRGRAIVIPDFGIWMAIAVAAATIPCLINPGHYENAILDAMCFVVLALAGYQSWDREKIFKKISICNEAATLLVIAYGALQMFHVEPFPGLWHNNYPASFFGFQNMTAEFLGISFLIQCCQNGFLKSWARVLLIVVTAAAMITTDCRAAMIALIVGTLFLVDFRVTKKMVLGLAALIAAVTVLTIANPTKLTNTNNRLIRWANTAYMIWDRPMGIGPGNYQFTYLSYKNRYRPDTDIGEHSLAKSPHNEYLGAGAEWGLAFIYIVLLAIIYILVETDNALCKSIFAFAAVDALFAFPMENAYPFFVVAVMVGIAIRSVPIVLGTARHYLLGSALLFVLILSMAFGFSKVTETQLTDSLNANAVACAQFPSNWRPCMQYAHLLGLRGRMPAAEKVLKESLVTTPNMFPARRLLAWALLNQGKTDEGLDELRKYDAIFDNASQFHTMISGVSQ